jgi:hypothetical protein
MTASALRGIIPPVAIDWLWIAVGCYPFFANSPSFLITASPDDHKPRV